jgi:hypothetical protein
LIFIRPELDPYWHPIGEWTIGRNGWIMIMAFLISAIGYGALFIALRKIITVGYGNRARHFIYLPAPGRVETQQMNLTTTGMLHMMGGGTVAHVCALVICTAYLICG